jgi:hypothetical protein
MACPEPIYLKVFKHRQYVEKGIWYSHVIAALIISWVVT